MHTFNSIESRLFDNIYHSLQCALYFFFLFLVFVFLDISPVFLLCLRLFSTFPVAFPTSSLLYSCIHIQKKIEIKYSTPAYSLFSITAGSCPYVDTINAETLIYCLEFKAGNMGTNFL